MVMELEFSLNDKPQILLLNRWSRSTMNRDAIAAALWHLSQHQLSFLFQHPLPLLLHQAQFSIWLGLCPLTFYIYHPFSCYSFSPCGSCPCLFYCQTHIQDPASCALITLVMFYVPLHAGPNPAPLKSMWFGLLHST